MKPPPFAYTRPTSLTEALEVLAADPDALPLAGGQSLVPMLNLRLARPTTVVDITRIPGLTEVTARPGSVRIGGRITHHALARVPELAMAPALAAAISEIGFQAIRHRGTLGGSLAHADPAAELATVLLALDADVTLTSTSGERRLPLHEFLIGYYSTSRQQGELITSVDVPLPAQLVTGFSEFSRRPGDFALALCAVARWDDRQARVVVGGLDVRPRRLTVVEDALVEGGEGAAVAVVTPEVLAAATSPSSDIHGSADYRLMVGAEVVRRALASTVARAA